MAWMGEADAAEARAGLTDLLIAAVSIRNGGRVVELSTAHVSRDEVTASPWLRTRLGAP